MSLHHRRRNLVLIDYLRSETTTNRPYKISWDLSQIANFSHVEKSANLAISVSEMMHLQFVWIYKILYIHFKLHVSVYYN